MTKPVDHTAIERFVLNRAVTAHHRDQLVADGELEPTDDWCCYSQCSMLVVGDPGPAPARSRCRHRSCASRDRRLGRASRP